ncbi:hypothetical protein EYC84_001502 [Monilinia fructicola]|uniref:Uncharacterized protein n=1 Tax=Monilinia fructicola TaxID=38448 RepID=A0A5M9JUQ8_MONFR|nr:hypothetical protein EYC84_001502 [Monilinia fructicola]
MATQVKICSDIKLSNSPESFHESCDTVDAIDAEMISPLTSIDNDSTRSVTPDKMDAFHSAREREERIRRTGSSQSQTPAPNMGPNFNTNEPGPTYPLPEQINSAFAYGIRRADGSFTRLLPADELPALNGVPRHQGPEGLIIVPELHHRSPKPEYAIPMIPNKVVAKLPPLPPPAFGLNQQPNFRRPGDQTQLAIDTIVASAVAPR